MSLNNTLKEFTLKHFPYTDVLGLSRSVIALGTLLTLLTNSAGILMQKTDTGEYLNPLINPIADINRFNFFLLFGADQFDLMRYLAIFLLLLVISGYLIKITSIFHWWVSISFFLSSSVIDGGDQIASILSFLLIPICLTDGRKNHWDNIDPYSKPKNIIGIVAVNLIRLQIAVIYFHAAVGKFDIPEWRNGTALYYWLNHSFFGMPGYLADPMNYMMSNKWVVSILTYSVLIGEITLFLCLTASKKIRKLIFPFAVLFHFLIIIYHGIFSFFFSIAGGLIIYLLPINSSLNLKSWFQKKLNTHTQ